jgi:hypothetical protein
MKDDVALQLQFPSGMVFQSSRTYDRFSKLMPKRRRSNISQHQSFFEPEHVINGFIS